MEDIIEAILEELFDGFMGSRRVARIIKCVVLGILGIAITALCIAVGGKVGWILGILMAVMFIVAIRKTYRGR